MTSLFEQVGPRNELPIDLIAPGVQAVSLLEFLTIDEGEVVPQAMDEPQVEPVAAADEKDSQMRLMVDLARAEAAAETRRFLEGDFEARLAEERARLRTVFAQFTENRSRYFAEAEAQVVSLALTIAAKILHREVVADAMHLEHTVRAALGRVSDGSATVLRVRPEQVERWTNALTQSVETKVSVAADAALQAGDCVLETSIGRVELGVATQLGEVEQRFRHMLTRAVASGDAEAAEGGSKSL